MANPPRAGTIYPESLTQIAAGVVPNIYQLKETSPTAANLCRVDIPSPNATTSLFYPPDGVVHTATGDPTDGTNDQKGWGFTLAEFVPSSDTVVIQAQTINVTLNVTLTTSGSTLTAGTFVPKACLWKLNPVTGVGTIIVATTGASVSVPVAVPSTNEGAATPAPINMILSSDVVFSANEVLYVELGGTFTTANTTLGGVNTGIWRLKTPATKISFPKPLSIRRSRSLSDSPTITDAISRAINRKPSLSDSTVTSEGLVRRIVQSRSLTDGATLSESFARTYFARRALSDNISPSGSGGGGGAPKRQVIVVED